MERATVTAFLRDGRMPPRSTHPRHQQQNPLRRGHGAYGRRRRSRRIEEEEEPRVLCFFLDPCRRPLLLPRPLPSVSPPLPSSPLPS
jgi:hypothetical protein